MEEAMKAENLGIRLVNKDDDALDIYTNIDGEGYVLRCGGAEWWIDDIRKFAEEVTKLANA